MTKAKTMDCFMIISRKLRSKDLHQRTATNKVKPARKICLLHLQVKSCPLRPKVNHNHDESPKSILSPNSHHPIQNDAGDR